MSYTMSDLITDVLPRAGRLENQSGITIYGAATSVQSMIYKRLLNRKSDLIADGRMSIRIPAFSYKAALPSDFVSFAEKPEAIEAGNLNWMAGLIVSYDNTTGVLYVDISVLSDSSYPTYSISPWNIEASAVPPATTTTIGTSDDFLVIAVGSVALTTQPGLNLLPGQYVRLASAEIDPTQIIGQKKHHLEPRYMIEDSDHDEYGWWTWYGIYGESWDPPCIRPRTYKIIDDSIYFRPKLVIDTVIKGKYNFLPSQLKAPADVIPWSGKFDEVFREGTLRILTKGIAIPDSDQDFEVFIRREVDTVINARISLLPNARRIKRGNYM